MEVKDLDAATARQWLDEGRAELIDIRDAGERRRARIPAARWMPLAGLDAGLKAEPAGPVGIFHCQSGRRTRLAAEQLAAVGYGETYVLAGGLGPDNAAEAVRRRRPWGEDASSGLESSPGRKGPALITAFVRAAKEASVRRETA